MSHSTFAPVVVALLSLLLSCALAAPARAQHDTALDPDAQLNISIAEMIQYTGDFAAAMHFYRDLLGWPAVIEADGYALFDIYGSYRLALIDMKWDSAWKPGDKVSAPQLSVQTDSIEQSCAILEQRGWTVTPVIDPQGPMPVCTITDEAGHELVIWQDSEARQLWPLKANPVGMYGMAEMLIFVEDRARAEEFYKSSMELTFVDSHDDVYVGLATQEGGFPLGLFEWADWWDTPAEGVPPPQPRLVIEARDIASEHARLSANGLPCGELKGSTEDLQWFCVTDPDGQRVTFWQFDAAAGKSEPATTADDNGVLRADMELILSGDSHVFVTESIESDSDMKVLDEVCQSKGYRLIWVDRFVKIEDRASLFAAFDACLGTYDGFGQDMSKLMDYLFDSANLPAQPVLLCFRDLQGLHEADRESVEQLLGYLDDLGYALSEQGRTIKTLVSGVPTE